MALSQGKPQTIIGLIDGPVIKNHPDLAREQLRKVPEELNSICTQAASTACQHGTFVAGILLAKPNSPAPATCPNCTLLVRPIFAETITAPGEMPSATPEELVQAILDCILYA
jgi:hypothetical protein